MIIPPPGLIDPEWVDLVSNIQARLSHDNLALLIGSAVSAPAPGGVPIAGLASAVFVEKLVGTVEPTQRDRLLAGLTTVPFEVLMGRLKELWPQRADDAVDELCSISAPNAVHQQIADLQLQAARANVSLPAVTTNYDQGIELAVKQLDWPGDSRPQPVVWPNDIVPRRPSNEIFHIHGMLGDRLSYVLDFRDEYALKPWKIRHLRELLRGRMLLILGFSGEDLDVTDAVRGAEPAEIVWFKREAAHCDSGTWSLAAQMLVASTRSRGIAVAVSTSDRIEAALGPFAPSVGATPSDGKAIAANRYARLFPSPSPPWTRIWARWVALRAGLADLVEAFPPDEEALLTAEQRAKFAAFSHYYAARHRTAAITETRAARLDRRAGASGHEAIGHRALAVEFLNRGAYTVDAISTVLSTLVETELGLLTGRQPLSRSLVRDLVIVLTRLASAWPSYPLAMTSSHFRAVTRWVRSRTVSGRDGRAFDWDMITGMATSPPGSQDYFRRLERYRWLGLAPRLINLTRRAAFATLWNNQDRPTEGTLRSAERDAACSLRWALIARDPARLAKCTLVLAEVLDQLTCEKLNPNHLTELVITDSRAAGWEPAKADAWATLRAVELSPFVRRLARSMYQRGDRQGPARGRRSRLIGLALLETS